MSSRIPAPITALIAVVSAYAAKRGLFSRSTKNPVGVVRRNQMEEGKTNVVRAGFIIAVGYRYQPLTEGLLFRIGLTGRNSGGFMDQAFHLSLGYAF